VWHLSGHYHGSSALRDGRIDGSDGEGQLGIVLSIFSTTSRIADSILLLCVLISATYAGALGGLREYISEPERSAAFLYPRSFQPAVRLLTSALNRGGLAEFFPRKF